MEALSQLIDGLVAHPAECFAALLLLAVVYLYKAREADKRASDERYDKLNEARMATVEKVIPVAEKLADGVSTLERLMEKVG